MTNSTVSDNTAGFQGGGIFSEGNATVTNSVISGNISSNGSGGGIFNFGEIEVVNSNIAGNTAEFQGGGIFSDGGQVTVADSTIIGNTANNSNGGGIANSEDSTVEIARSTITNNTSIAPNSIDGGGGLFNRGEAIVSDSMIARNTTGGQGGGVKNEGGTIEIARSNIVGNSANGGAGISNTEPQEGRISLLTVRDSDIIGNIGNVGPGGIDNSGGIVEIEKTTIVGNTANVGGGGIGNNDGGILSVIKGTISGNTAGTDGGGILNDGDTIATDSTISLNIADFDRDGIGDGGGFFNSAAGTFTNNNSLIFGNTPNDVFTEGMLMMDGAAFTDMA